MVGYVVSRRDEGKHGRGVPFHLVLVQVQLDPVSVDETLQRGQEEAGRQIRPRFDRNHVKHRPHPENRKRTLSRRHAWLARAGGRWKDPEDVRTEHADDQEHEDQPRHYHGADCWIVTATIDTDPSNRRPKSTGGSKRAEFNILSSRER